MDTVNKEQIYLDFKGKVTGFIAKKISDYGMVEDLTMDVFEKVYRNIDRFDETKASLSTWIYTITNNTVLDYFRTRKVHQELPSDSGEDGIVPDCLVDSTEVDYNLLSNERLSELAAALKKIPERERDIIILHYYKGETLKDIAAKLGMSYANIKIVHKKALGGMKLALSQAG